MSSTPTPQSLAAAERILTGIGITRLLPMSGNDAADAIAREIDAATGLPALLARESLLTEVRRVLERCRATIVSAVESCCDLPDFDASQHVTVKEIDALLAKLETP